MRDKFGRTGGLRTEGSVLGSWSSHAQIGRAPGFISGVSFSLRFASERVVVVLLFAVFAVLRFRQIWQANPFLKLCSPYLGNLRTGSSSSTGIYDCIIFVQATLCLFISPLGAQQQFLQWIFWLAGPANSSALHGAACGNVTSI